MISEEYASSLGYESKVSEVLETIDGSNFTASCTRSYTDLSTTKTSSMMGQISNALSGSECGEIVTSVIHLLGFITAGNKVSSKTDYYIVLRTMLVRQVSRLIDLLCCVTMS